MKDKDLGQDKGEGDDNNIRGPKDKDFRLAVGAMVFNRQGLVLVGERINVPTKGSMQMPQGGVDEGEDMQDTLYRELYEEMGINKDSLELVAEAGQFYYYRFPSEEAYKGLYIGQKLKWFLLRMIGPDSDIRLDLHEHREFARWKWIECNQLSKTVVWFKKPMYEAIVKEFAPLIKPF